MRYLTDLVNDDKDFFRSLKYFGIGKDLKYFSEREMSFIDANQMPRYIISNKK